MLADGRLTGAIPRLTARQDTCGLALTRRAWPGQSSSGEDGTTTTTSVEDWEQWVGRGGAQGGWSRPLCDAGVTGASDLGFGRVRRACSDDPRVQAFAAF